MHKRDVRERTNYLIGAYLISIIWVKEFLVDLDAPNTLLAIISQPTPGIHADHHVEPGV